jgi:hypothetical protein
MRLPQPWTQARASSTHCGGCVTTMSCSLATSRKPPASFYAASAGRFAVRRSGRSVSVAIGEVQFAGTLAALAADQTSTERHVLVSRPV